MSLATILGAAAPVVGGLVGSIASSGSQSDAQAKQAAALAAAQGLSAPDAQQLQVDLALYQSTGQMTPALQSVISQQDTALSGITTDPRLQQAQMAALSSLQQQGQGGLTPADIASLSQVTQNAAGVGQSQQAAALQAMQQRGVGGSGSELAARLSAGQNASNQAMTAGLDIQGQAAQRALAAIAASGQLGASMQSTSFNQQAQQAAAQDAINKYNAANSQQVLGSNTSTQNAAQAANLANAQQIANLNTQTQQTQAQLNAQAQQTAYQDQLQKAQLASGALNTAAGQDLTRAGQTQSLYTGIGQGVGQAATAAAKSPATTTASTPSTTTPSSDNYTIPNFGASSGY